MAIYQINIKGLHICYSVQPFL